MKINMTKPLVDKLLIQTQASPLLEMNLSFFEGEKTEKATPRKKRKAREEGQVAKSQEVGTAFLIISTFVALRSFAPYMIKNILEIFSYSFSFISDAEYIFTTRILSNYVSFLFLRMLLIVMPIFAVAMVVGVLTNLAQVGWHPTTKPLKPKFSNMNPLKGFKKIISFKSLLELVKSLLKFTVILIAVYNILKDEINSLAFLIHMELFAAVSYVSNIAIELGINIGILYLIIAILDIAYQRFKHSKELRMSKQEVKEEYKQTEGDPQIKGKIRQRMREASMRRMMHEIPTADVIITNPTHFAVALKYEREKGEPPKVIAKGMDFVALKIKDMAKEHNVTIVENKPLARTLYATVEVGGEIPPELYQAVAEVLAYVYKLKKIA